MYSECDEVAASIHQARDCVTGNGLNVTMPIRTMDDALRVARHYMADETETVISNVAQKLLRLAKPKLSKDAILRKMDKIGDRLSEMELYSEFTEKEQAEYDRLEGEFIDLEMLSWQCYK